MNVIQQEALAKSVGMTREDLAKSLMEREAIAKLSDQEGKTAQEKFNNLVKEVGLEEAKKRLGDEQVANLFAGQSAQERFTAAVEKLKEVFVSIAEPLLPILDIFGKIAETVAPLAGFIGQTVKYAIELGKYLLPIYGIYKGILLFQQRGLIQAKAAAVFNKLGLITDKQKLFYQSRLTYFENVKKGIAKENLILENSSIVNSLKKNTLAAIAVVHERMANLQKRIGVGFENAMLAVKQKGILTTIKDLALQGLAKAKKLGSMLVDVGSLAISSAKAVAGIPIIGPLLAVGAAAGGIALGLGLYNRFKGDDVVSPGYGKRTLLAPEGAIDLNNKDTVIAGTNLGGGSNQSANSSSPSINLSPLIERMSAVENLLSQILSKEGTVFLDGNKVGTAMAMGTYKTQ
jgi:hypothetical protein